MRIFWQAGIFSIKHCDQIFVKICLYLEKKIIGKIQKGCNFVVEHCVYVMNKYLMKLHDITVINELM